jgi:hypothetical protein
MLAGAGSPDRETAKGRRILFIDTCHSGNAYNQQLGNAAYHANIIAYTATRFDQEALENAKLGHGALHLCGAACCGFAAAGGVAQATGRTCFGWSASGGRGDVRVRLDQWAGLVSS